jgi:hypothetical protein
MNDDGVEKRVAYTTFLVQMRSTVQSCVRLAVQLVF